MADEQDREVGLPDPLLMNDGRRASSPEDWLKRREEIKTLLCDIEYGHMPPAPGNLGVQEHRMKTVFEGRAA